METLYRETPIKRKKGDRWIIQRTLDRKQVGKSFRVRAEAIEYKLKLDVNSAKLIERSDPIQRLTVEDIDILLGNLKVFFKKLYKLKQTIAVKKK